MEKRLTVLMAFRNEGEEVALTCQSIRETAGDAVDIVVVDDASDDKREYKEELEPYNVLYIRNQHRCGSSIGKDVGVQACKTPYFLILDAHCRFYTKNWLEILNSVLDKDDYNTVYCCGCQFFYDETDHQDPKHPIAYGAYMPFKAERILQAKWNTCHFNQNLIDIPVVMGANYICSKSWWDKLGGFKGLKLYGREEEYISFKSWLAGGYVKCITNIVTGHKGRKKGVGAPYKAEACEVWRNEMVLARVCCPEMFEKLQPFWIEHYKKISKSLYEKAETQYNEEQNVITPAADEFKKIQKYPFSYFDQVINKSFQTNVKIFNEWRAAERKNKKSS